MYIDARSALHPEHHDLAMASGVDGFVFLVKRQVVYDHRRFFLGERLLGRHVQKDEEPVLVAAAGGQQPVTPGMKAQVLDQTLELVAGEAVLSLGRSARSKISTSALPSR